MDFVELLNKNHEIIVSTSEKVNVDKDEKAINDELNKLEKALDKSLCGDNVDFELDFSKAIKKKKDELIFDREGTVFDLFFKLTHLYFVKKDIPAAREVYETLKIESKKDYNACVALSLCKLYGIFEKKSEVFAWEEINEYACHLRVGIACSLLGQHYYHTYLKNKNSDALKLAKEFISLGIRAGSKTAIAFNNIFHLI